MNVGNPPRQVNYHEIAKNLWQTEHPGGASVPDIDVKQHWKIDNTNPNTNFGTHESDTDAIRELMTPGITITNDNTQVETYLSAATLLACVWPSLRAPQVVRGGLPVRPRRHLFHPTEHGTGTDIEVDILPGYCSHASSTRPALAAATATAMGAIAEPETPAE